MRIQPGPLISSLVNNSLLQWFRQTATSRVAKASGGGCIENHTTLDTGPRLSLAWRRGLLLSAALFCVPVLAQRPVYQTSTTNSLAAVPGTAWLQSTNVFVVAEGAIYTFYPKSTGVTNGVPVVDGFWVSQRSSGPVDPVYLGRISVLTLGTMCTPVPEPGLNDWYEISDTGSACGNNYVSGEYAVWTPTGWQPSNTPPHTNPGGGGANIYFAAIAPASAPDGSLFINSITLQAAVKSGGTWYGFGGAVGGAQPKPADTYAGQLWFNSGRVFIWTGSAWVGL